MSKLLHLNARVAKLLTQAVYEVLEAVKETVSEYQEKTARTQRENESLKQRLQELQDKIATERFGHNSLENQRTVSHLQQKQNAALSTSEQKEISIYKPVNNEEPINTPTQAQEEAFGSKADVTNIIKEEVTVHTPHISSITNRSINPAPAISVGASQFGCPVEADLSVVKNEPGPSEEFSEVLLSPHTVYTSFLDLRCTSSRQTPAQAPRAHVDAEDQRPVNIHSSTAISKRNTLARRITFDVTKVRRDNFQSEETHLCIICGKTFSRIGNLRIHQRCHTGEKPYGCVLCGRRFTQAGDLKKHKRVHTGEKPYYCNQCGKSFSRRENLKRHQRIHIDETLRLQQVWREQQLSVISEVSQTSRSS